MAAISPAPNARPSANHHKTVAESLPAHHPATTESLPAHHPATPESLPTHPPTTTGPATAPASQHVPDVPSVASPSTTSNVPAPQPPSAAEPALKVPAVEPVATEPASAPIIASLPVVPVPVTSLPAVPLASIPVSIPTAGAEALHSIPTTQLPVAVPSIGSQPATTGTLDKTLEKPASGLAPSIATTSKSMRRRDMIKLLRPMLAVAPECVPIIVLLAQKNAAGVNVKPIIDGMLAVAGP